MARHKSIEGRLIQMAVSQLDPHTRVPREKVVEQVRRSLAQSGRQGYVERLQNDAQKSQEAHKELQEFLQDIAPLIAMAVMPPDELARVKAH